MRTKPLFSLMALATMLVATRVVAVDSPVGKWKTPRGRESVVSGSGSAVG